MALDGTLKKVRDNTSGRIISSAGWNTSADGASRSSLQPTTRHAPVEAGGQWRMNTSGGVVSSPPEG